MSREEGRGAERKGEEVRSEAEGAQGRARLGHLWKSGPLSEMGSEEEEAGGSGPGWEKHGGCHGESQGEAAVRRVAWMPTGIKHAEWKENGQSESHSCH